jgi:hypothetical protein
MEATSQVSSYQLSIQGGLSRNVGKNPSSHAKNKISIKLV